MTAQAQDPFEGLAVEALVADASPAAIRDALVDEERSEFELAYQQAMAEAARTLDLVPVLEVLRHYHRIARVTRHRGPARHRALLEKAALIERTGGNPDGIPLGEVLAGVDRRRG